MLFFKRTFKTSLQLLNAWRPHEDKLLLERVEKYGPAWTFVSFAINSRSPVECRKRFLKLTRALDTYTHPAEKDFVYEKGYEKIGKNWVHVPYEELQSSPFELISSKIAKKTLKEKRNKAWTELELMALREGYDQHGGNWVKIAAKIPRRTAAQCQKAMENRYIHWNQK